MKPIRVFIDRQSNSALSIDEIKYTIKTLLTIAGLPCHFVKSAAQVDIYYGNSHIDDRTLFIEMSNVKKDTAGIPLEVTSESSYSFFFYGKQSRKKDIVVTHGLRKAIYNDIVLSSFYLLTGCQERFLKRDKRDFFNIKESFFYKEKLIHLPIVTDYAFMLKDIFANSHEPAPLWPNGKKYAVALSHDIDYPEMVRSIEILRYALKYKRNLNISRMLDIARGKETFWKFEDWMNLEKQYGMKSAFYFCGFKGSLPGYFLKSPDPFYDVLSPRYKHVMRSIVEKGFEVGMHASYFAYKTAEGFIKEKKKIEQALGGTIFGNRHHYWHMDPEKPFETASIHHKAGLLYDSSLAFEHRAGFRNGISHPFHLYDPVNKKSIKTLQLPPTLMDSHLSDYAKYGYLGNYEDEIDALLSSVKRSGGVIVSDYHERGLNTTFYPQWEESYKYLLKKIAACNDFYCDIPVNICRHWLDRERMLDGMSKDEDSCSD